MHPAPVAFRNPLQACWRALPLDLTLSTVDARFPLSLWNQTVADAICSSAGVATTITKEMVGRPAVDAIGRRLWDTKPVVGV
jgi:hypothetical protein